MDLSLDLAGLLDSGSPTSNPPTSHSPSSDSGYRGNSSGGDSAEDSGAQGIHLLLRPPDLLAPSLPPPLPPLSQPTLTPPPSWDQVPFLEEGWGSGDYLETLSFLLPDGEELALATPLPDHPFDDDDDDDEGGDWFSFNHAFPARPTLALSSRLPLSPASPTASVPAHTRLPRPDVFPAWDEDYDLEDMSPLEPTELLLPDMNSLEYYTNLLAREEERQRGRDPERGGPEPAITPTQTQTQHPPLTPPPSPTPPEQGSKQPPAGPSPPPTPPTPGPEGGPPDPVRHPGSPPSNTTGHTPSSPPARPPLLPERPQPPPSRATAGTPTTQATISLTRAPPATTPRAAQAPPTRQYLCNVTKPEMYLVRVGKTLRWCGGGRGLQAPDSCLCPCSEFQRFFSGFQPGQRSSEEGAEHFGGAPGSSSPAHRQVSSPGD